MRSWRRSEVGPISRAYAWLVVKFRWGVALGWAVLLVAAAVWLPGAVPHADLGRFAPPNSQAVATETASAKAFGFPILSRTMVVQHDETGLSPAAQHRVVERAAAVAQHKVGDIGPIAAVVPIMMGVIAAFGVPTFPGGMAMRQSFLVKDGKVAWYCPNAQTSKHAQEVEAAVAKLK